ncbi:MAG: L-glutamate gamma-semialdehyde dehydrogenase [Acidobacteriota bacterium]
MLPQYHPETYTDFAVEAHRQAQENALQNVGRQLGREFRNVIAGKPLGAASTFTSLNPSLHDQVVGIFPRQDAGAADTAVEATTTAFADWSQTEAVDRAAILLRTANIMRRRRMELNAWEIYETGKPWREADADVAEAIDFCEFYAREAIRYSRPQPLTPLAGEMVDLHYIPLGVGAIIPPWNFPLAILCGMTTAAIAAGNTVVLKPSSDAPAVGALFRDILAEAGLPDGVLNFITGPGSTVGAALVRHPKVRFVAFTGSREVGLALNAEAARPREGQIWIKRTILEMGGKDFTIVDADADLDAAAAGILAGAFGFQGQKCSACSRAILHQAVHDAVVERLVEGAKKLTVGDTRQFQHQMGPVINQAALEKITGYIEIGRKEGRLVTGEEPVPGGGYFIRPTTFVGVEPGARIAREEIFGPVLSVLRAESFDRALELANDTEYGLTGAVYSRNRSHLAQARRQAHAGNLYLNRKCTGALVGVHPFGGFNMSGTDSKAGGRDYLLLFSQAKSIAEAL